MNNGRGGFQISLMLSISSGIAILGLGLAK
jgi:hypothetical protein